MGLQLQAAYAFSDSLDWASSFEETVNPFDYKASRALSLFNSPQRFVISSYWELSANFRNTIDSKEKFWMTGRCPGIVQFQSGFPLSGSRLK